MSRSREAVIVSSVRTPLGKGRQGGALADWHPVDLLGQVIAEVVDRGGLEGDAIDDVIAGCVSQAGEQAANVARNAVLAAGLPESVPGTTVDRQCGSSQQAAHFAAQGVISGAYDAVVACGVEMMSRVPMFSPALDKDPAGPLANERFGGLIDQGISAELIAAKWGISREENDAFAARSHELAGDARARGALAAQILPVATKSGGGEVSEDEGIRPGTSVETLAKLKPVFEDESYKQRFPEIDWVIHAGNASQISDGAAALLIMERGEAEKRGLRPRARFHSFSVVGSDPLLMLTGVIPATQKALERGDLDVSDIDLFEVNEAFAPVVLAWQREMGAELDRVNVDGGAIALGHPLGCSGARLMTSLLHSLEERDARYGLQTMCEGGGMANATVIERLD